MTITSKEEPAVICRNVTVTAGKKHILRDCSFNLPQGSCTGVIGPNGAGKTTMLGLCNGFILPQSGTVHCFGKSVTAKTASHLRKRIGYVAQWRNIDPRQPITVFDSVLCGTYGKLGLLHKPGKKERGLAEQSLNAVGVAHLAKRPLGHLSGGEAQRVAIARALAQKPELLLLDEPTASLDWQARRDILQLVGTLRRSLTLTVLMVTHELNALAELCDFVFFVKQGSVIWQGPAREAVNADRLSALYDTPVTVLEHNEQPVVLV